MRNIMLHAAVHGDTAADGTLTRVRVTGYAFGLERLMVTLEGPHAHLAGFAVVHPRTSEWGVSFDDAGALKRAGVEVGVRVRVVAADGDDEAGCFSSNTVVVERE